MAMAKLRLVKLRKWRQSARGATKYLGVRLHALKKTHKVRHNFSVCWVWKQPGAQVRRKDVMQGVPQEAKGWRAGGPGLVEPPHKEELHPAPDRLLSQVGACETAAGMQTTTTAEVVGGLWSGGGCVGARDEIQIKAFAPRLGHELLEHRQGLRRFRGSLSGNDRAAPKGPVEFGRSSSDRPSSKHVARRRRCWFQVRLRAARALHGAAFFCLTPP